MPGVFGLHMLAQGFGAAPVTHAKMPKWQPAQCSRPIQSVWVAQDGAAKQSLVLDCKREHWLAEKIVPMLEPKDYGKVTAARRIEELMWIVCPFR